MVLLLTSLHPRRFDDLYKDDDGSCDHDEKVEGRTQAWVEVIHSMDREDFGINRLERGPVKRNSWGVFYLSAGSG